MTGYKTLKLATAFIALMAGAGSAFAASHVQPGHDMQNHGKMQHEPATSTAKSLPLEPGQGAFATIAEIVVLLSNDPMTDWGKVNIDALREHLIDMDEVVLRATSTTKIDGNKIIFTVTGSGRTKKAIQAMVPAHAGVLARTTAWNVTGEVTETGAVMTLTSDNAQVLNVIKALGFYGVMATGAHHQVHHFAMAKGENGDHAHASD